MAARPSQRGRARRAVVAALTVAVAVAGVVGLVSFFVSRDAPQVSSQQARGPGQAFPDLGARHLRPGEPPGVRFNSSPPTSGPHVAVTVRRNAATISNDQLLHAIELGNVVILYGSPRPPPALRGLAEEASGPFDPALIAGGQAVILARRPGVDGVVAVAWRHLQPAASPSDPALRRFVDFWLGRGHGR